MNSRMFRSRSKSAKSDTVHVIVNTPSTQQPSWTRRDSIQAKVHRIRNDGTTDNDTKSSENTEVYQQLHCY